MGKRLVFTNDGNEITAYLNDKGMCFITTNDVGDGLYSGYICLDKEDLLLFIAELNNIAAEMEGE